MSEITMDEFLADNRDAILVGVQARMRGHETMVRVAEHSEISESDLGSQVIGFWLQAIRTDLELGSTAAIEQNLQWLVRLRIGQEVPFDDPMVMRTFDDISAEIEERLESDTLREEYATYRARVRTLIVDAFPEAAGGQQ
jgi:hypothetical protein